MKSSTGYKSKSLSWYKKATKIRGINEVEMQHFRTKTKTRKVI
jgi:hypothetical protein